VLYSSSSEILALLANVIIIIKKNLPGTNTPAYFEPRGATLAKEISFLTTTSGHSALQLAFK
jgi:hypothetical protein